MKASQVLSPEVSQALQHGLVTLGFPVEPDCLLCQTPIDGSVEAMVIGWPVEEGMNIQGQAREQVHLRCWHAQQGRGV